MTDTDLPYMPSLVRQTYDDVLKATGTAPTLTRPDNVTYQLDHGNDTVHLVCRWRRRSTKGRRGFAYTSTLTVNGVPREWVKSADAYARLLLNPADTHPDRKPGAELPPIHPLADGEERPPMVAKVVAMVEDSGTNVHLTVGHSSVAQRQRWGAWTYKLNEDDERPDPDGWVVESTTAVGNRVQLYFQPDPKIAGSVYFSGISAIDDQGRDCMSEYGKDIEKALEGLLGINIPHKPEDTATGRSAKTDTRGAASNAVTVRRATVFRV